MMKMEKVEYEELSRRHAELEGSRHLAQTKLSNLRRVDPAIPDFDARKTELEKELSVVFQEQNTIRVKLEQAKPLLDIQTSHEKAKAIPKILISISLDQQPKELDDDLGYEHCYQPCNHTAKLSIYDLIPDSQPAAWNALVDQLADFNGHIHCPKCIAEKNGLRAKLMEKINALRAKMPEATIADQEPHKTVSTARFNVHIKK
jgi:hypothetical protein